MKTSHKLLAGLIIFFFVVITVFVGLAKYYEASSPEETGSDSGEEQSSLSLPMESTTTRVSLYFPVVILPTIR